MSFEAAIPPVQLGVCYGVYLLSPHSYNNVVSQCACRILVCIQDTVCITTLGQ
jgi:hypothetical protein